MTDDTQAKKDAVWEVTEARQELRDLCAKLDAYRQAANGLAQDLHVYSETVENRVDLMVRGTGVERRELSNQLASSLPSVDGLRQAVRDLNAAEKRLADARIGAMNLGIVDP